MQNPTLEFHGVNGKKLYMPIGFRARDPQLAPTLRLSPRQFAAALLPHDEVSTRLNERPLKLDLGLAQRPRQPVFPGWSKLVLARSAKGNRVSRQKPDQAAIHPGQFRISQIELVVDDGILGFFARARNRIADFITEAFDKFRRIAAGPRKTVSQFQDEQFDHDEAGGKFYVLLTHGNPPLCGMRPGEIRPINATMLQRMQASTPARNQQGRAFGAGAAS